MDAFSHILRIDFLSRWLCGHSLAQRTLKKAALRIAIVIMITTAIGYIHIKRASERQALGALEEYVQERCNREGEIFLLAKENHTILAKELLSRLQSISVEEARAAFDRRVMQYPDGVWRNREDSFNGTKQPCIFIDNIMPIDDTVRSRIAVFYDLCAQYGPAWRDRFQDTYIHHPDGILVLYWPEMPNWCRDAPASLEISQEEYSWVADAAHNLDRQTAWTGMFYDHVAKTWMVSCETPVDFNGQHIATLGHDIVLDELLQRAVHDHLPSARNILFRADGRLIAHPELMDKIREQKGRFLIPEEGDESLKSAYKITVELPTDRHLAVNPVNGAYLGIGWIPGPDWYFVIELSKSAVSGPAADTARIILFLGFLSLAIEGLILYAILRRHIARPLGELVHATNSIAGGDLTSQVHMDCDDELGVLASSIEHMRSTIHDQMLTLKRNEEQLRIVNDNVPGIVYQFYARPNGDWGLYYFSGSSKPLFGLDNNPLETVFARFAAQVAPEHRTAFMESIETAVREKAPWEFEGRFIHSNGETLWFKGISYPTPRDEELLFNGIIFNVTERKRSEEALRRREETFRALAENSADVIMRFDRQFRHLYVNPAVEKTAGMPACDFIGKTHEELGFPKSLYLGWEEAIQKVFLTRQVGHLEFQLPNGTWQDWLLMPELAEDGSVTAVITSARDITERKNAETLRESLEEQLRQAQKMDSIGRLAGGIAHDFNNILAVILGGGELMIDTLPAGSPEREQLEEMMKAAERAKILTRQLLAFSRKQVLDIKIIDLNEMVLGIDKMIQRLLREDIHICLKTGGERLPVRADLFQLEQVLLNLCVNARDAMPDGGTLTIETGSQVLNEHDVRNFPGMQAGFYVVMGVRDTGCGMDEVTQRQIFDPFFTTKSIGKGTGLGLATAYGIVKQHGGEITVTSEPKKGALFTVYLPRDLGKAITDENSAPSMPEPGNGEVILILEDEDSVRKLYARMLARLGYEVIEAENAQVCIEYFQSARRIDLLLTDVIMPQMNGRQVQERVVAIRPSIKTLFMSGYSEDVIAQQGVLEEGIHFISKPFNEIELSLKIQEVLHG